MKARKILSVLLVCVMLLGVMSFTAMAEDIILPAKTYSADHTITLEDNQTLIISGDIEVKSGATLTVKGGNVVVNDSTSRVSILLYSGKIVFDGVNFSATKSKANTYLFDAVWGGSVTFKNSTVTLTDTFALIYNDESTGSGTLNVDNSKIYLKSGCSRIALGTDTRVNLTNGSLIDADNLGDNGFRNVTITVDNSTIDIDGCGGTAIKNTNGVDVTVTGNSTISVANVAESPAINLTSGSVLYATKDADITVDSEAYTGVTLITQPVAKIGDDEFETLQAAVDAATDGQTVTLVKDVTISERITIERSLTLDGADKKITLDTDSRAIDIPNTATNADVTIKNLTIEKGNTGWFERAINYNTGSKLVLDNVKVSGATYAVNFPSSADGAVVEIKNSELSGLNTINIWGSDMTIDIVDTDIISVDETAIENYMAITLNNDGTNSAENTVVTVTGGSITAYNEKGEASVAVNNSTDTGYVTISESTTVNGEIKKMVAMIGLAGFHSIYDAFAVAKDGDTITLVGDVYTGNNEKDSIVIEGKDITLDLNGKVLAQTITDRGASVAAIVIREDAALTVKDGVGGGKISGTTTPIQLAGTLNLESGTIACDVEPTAKDIENSFLNTVWIYTEDATAAPTFNMTGGSLLLGETQKSFTYADAIYISDDMPVSTFANTSVTISAGTVEGTITAEGLEDKISITGGNFTTDISVFIPEGTSVTENADGTYTVEASAEWTTGTDAGAYGDGTVGMMRWLFALDIDGAAEASGIRYIEANDITSTIKGTATGTASKAFYGDVVGVPDGTTGTYYAVAYVTIGEKTYWSKPVACTPDFERVFTDYVPEV